MNKFNWLNMLIKWHELQIIIVVVVAGCLRPRINLHNYYETIVIALYTYISYIAYATCDIYLNDIISCCAQLSGNNTSPCGMLCYVNLSHVCPSLSVCLLPSLSVRLSVNNQVIYQGNKYSKRGRVHIIHIGLPAWTCHVSSIFGVPPIWPKPTNIACRHR